MAARILLVDDEPAILEIHRWNLSKAGYEVETALDGQDAQGRISTRPVDLVISDIRMPRLDGILLLEWVKRTAPATKVILTTGFAALMDTKRAIDLGCESFLPKPVAKDQLLAAVADALSGAAPPTDETAFERISIEDFLLAKPFEGAIFLRVAGGKFLQVASSADELDFERIYNLKSKGVGELWIQHESFQRAFGGHAGLAEAVRSPASAFKPAGSGLPAFDEARIEAERVLLKAGFRELTVQQGGEILAAAFEAVFNDMERGARDALIAPVLASPLKMHAFSGAVLAGMLSLVLEWSSKRNALILSAGTLLRDVALAGMDAAVQATEPARMSESQKQKYLDHVKLGAEKLLGIQELPRELSLIVGQHHENNKGAGFPKRLGRHNIFPLAAVAHVADQYVTALLKAGDGAGAGRAVLEQMLAVERERYDYAAVGALQKALKPA